MSRTPCRACGVGLVVIGPYRPSGSSGNGPGVASGRRAEPAGPGPGPGDGAARGRPIATPDPAAVKAAAGGGGDFYIRCANCGELEIRGLV